MRRGLLALAALLVGLGAVYFLLIRDDSVAPQVTVPEATATIGSGDTAVAVSADGKVIAWFPLPAEPELPQLPLSEAPKNGRLAGPVQQQARVLGAAPAALRPYLASSYYGETGVDVETTTGIELRFGDASQATQKWKAVAAVLADPTITALDYVDVHSPGHPAYGGSGHTLPPPP